MSRTERVRRYLDERERPTPFAPQGFLPVDHLATITRTGDRLLASDLRALLAAVERVEALADEWERLSDRAPYLGDDVRAIRAALKGDA